MLSTALCHAPSTASAQAQWTSNGLPVCVRPDCAGFSPMICGDESGGALIAWERNPTLSNQDLYVKRVLSNGSIALGWPTPGVLVVGSTGDQYLSDLEPDGSGGAFVAWYDWPNYDAYVQHVLGNGQLAPGWPVDGLAVAVTSGAQFDPRLLSDGAGGVFAIWVDGDFATASSVYALHLNGDGSRVTGWPAGGLPICTASGLRGAAHLGADGTGGIVAAWTDGRNYYRGEVFSQRITWSGDLVDGWPVDGKLIIAAGTAGGVRGIVPDGAGGAYIGWQHQEDPNFSDAEVYAVRMLADGSIGQGWPATGLRLTPGIGYQQLSGVVADSLGGVLLSWFDQVHPPAIGYVMRLRPDGTPAPGWPTGGSRVSDLPGYVLSPRLAPDGFGGSYVAYVVTGAGNHGYVQRLSANGAPAQGWPSSGVPVVVPTEFYAFQQDEPAITSDQRGGAIVTWTDERDGTPNRIYAQRYVGDGPTPALVSLVSAQALPDRVVLAWHDPSRVVGDATVYRRRDGEEWSALGHNSFDGTGRLQFEDTDVSPGERYAYRLGWREMVSEYFSAETWVDVPAALALDLEGARPNPAVGSFTVGFTLPHADAATLELLDVAGRRVAAREVGSLGPGQHQIRLGECGCTPPGMYWLRLTNAGRALIKRVAVVK
jgi:hypothetical protein